MRLLLDDNLERVIGQCIRRNYHIPIGYCLFSADINWITPLEIGARSPSEMLTLHLPWHPEYCLALSSDARDTMQQWVIYPQQNNEQFRE